jgi:hypothetical protein
MISVLSRNNVSISSSDYGLVAVLNLFGSMLKSANSCRC